MKEEIDSSVKENVKFKKFLTQKLEHRGKTKPKNKLKGEKSQFKGTENKHIQQEFRRKLSPPKGRHAYKGTRGSQNTK